MLNPQENNSDIPSVPAAQKPAEATPQIDIKERNRLIESCHKMAYSLANRFSKKFDVPFEKCIEAAEDALIKAADRFNPEKGYKFSTYAHPCIWLTLVRVTTTYNKIRYSTVSGDAPKYEEGVTLFDSMEDKTNPTEEEQAYKLSRMGELQRALGELSFEQRAIIEMLFFQEMSLKEAGEKLGMSKQTVANRRNEIIAKLQENMSAAA